VEPSYFNGRRRALELLPRLWRVPIHSYAPFMRERINRTGIYRGSYAHSELFLKCVALTWSRRMIDFSQCLKLKRLAKAGALVTLILPIPLTSAIGDEINGTAETIVFVRHGEKPEAGLGQLNCQGLNRALALPSVIAKSFGRPDVIFAPNPSLPKKDAGKLYDYVRPLATVEPTAIRFGLPVDVSVRFNDTEGLLAALEAHRAADRNALLLVAWEHHQIAPIARALLAAHGAEAETINEVEDWKGDDFDSIYIVTIRQRGKTTKANFAHGHEGLNGQPSECAQ